MPKRKSAYKLKELCLGNLAENMDKFWCSHYVHLFFGQSRFLYLLGPFDEVAGCICEELIDALRQRKLLKRSHLELILNSAVRHLNLSGWGGDLSNLPTTVTAKCQKLLHVDISGCSSISKVSFQQLMKSLSNVITLNLQYTSCSDAILASIGAHCKFLQELNISNCPVTDFGISSLCINLTDLDTKSNHCCRIKKLSLLETEVTEKGAACALKHLPLLVDLSFHNIFGALELLHKGDLDNNTLRHINKYHINNLSSHYLLSDSVSKDSLSISLVLCPNVKKLSLVNVEITNEDLILCAEFINLEELQWVSGCTGMRSDSAVFYDGLVAFLQMRGLQLVTLDLGELPLVDVAIIGQLCPNVTSFSLFLIEKYSHCISASLSKFKNYAPFNKLTSLSVLSENGESIPPASLKLLLKHCLQLQTLKLVGNNTLNDEIVEVVLQSNPLSAINTVHLERCSDISGYSIDKLILLDSCLKSVSCLGCNNVTRRDYQRWQQYVNEQNLNLQVHWL